MDLLGDVGNADQLTSTREENRVLRAKVKELTDEVRSLRIDKESLLAEVEEYRRLAALATTNDDADGGGTSIDGDGGGGVGGHDHGHDDDDAFVRSGDGSYVSDPAVTLSNLHGSANPLCCSLDVTDTLLLTGGADSTIRLCPWGAALAPGDESAGRAVDQSASLSCPAPVISAGFATCPRTPVLAGGCMDGTVRLASYHSTGFGSGGVGLSPLRVAKAGEGGSAAATADDAILKHVKYVKCLAWSPSQPILATGSADGTVRLTRLRSSTDFTFDEELKLDDGTEAGEVELTDLVTLHLPGPVEAMTFLHDGKTLCCHARGTSYLSYFDMGDGDYRRTKHSLNGDASTGGFDDHVSFAVMSLSPSPAHGWGDKFLAAATDSNRNIILETGTRRQVRNLYGHKNDGFSQPKIAWSSSGQYLYGNTQEDSSVCVWDVASSSIVRRLGGADGGGVVVDGGGGGGGVGHTTQIRDMFGSRTSDTLATASYDKSVKVWLPSM